MGKLKKIGLFKSFSFQLILALAQEILFLLKLKKLC